MKIAMNRDEPWRAMESHDMQRSKKGQQGNEANRNLSNDMMKERSLGGGYIRGTRAELAKHSMEAWVNKEIKHQNSFEERVSFEYLCLTK